MTEDIKAQALALIAECEQSWTEFANKAEIAQVHDTVRGLLLEIARLRVYVQHRPECASQGNSSTATFACTCGLEQ